MNMNNNQSDFLEPPFGVSVEGGELKNEGKCRSEGVMLYLIFSIL